jgi:hypothetical protein
VRRSPRVVQPHIPGLARVDKAPVAEKIKESALVTQIRATLANIGYATFEVGQARQKGEVPTRRMRRGVLSCRIRGQYSRCPRSAGLPQRRRVPPICVLMEVKVEKARSVRNKRRSPTRAVRTSSAHAGMPWRPCAMPSQSFPRTPPRHIMRSAWKGSSPYEW